MLKYILKRILYAILILLGVSVLLYFLVRLMPVSFVEAQIVAMSQGKEVDEMVIQAMYERYGLGDNSFGGILEGYFSWLGSIARFDFGTSWKYGDSVLDEIVDHMGVSFIIAFIAIILEYLIAIPLGVTAATHQYSVWDYTVTVLVMVGISLPSFFFGRVMQSVFSMQLGWFPPAGLTDASQHFTGIGLIGDYARHIFLPLVVMVLLSVGGTMRYMRTNMLEVLTSDYIRTARAKGLPESKVIYKHAFRNTMIPIVTMFAGVLPSLFSGAMITEQVFDLDGIGRRALDAMQAADIPFIMGYNMFLAFLSVLGVLLSDLMYAIVDPRVKLY